MDDIFKDLKEFCVAYIDDIFIFSKTVEEYKKCLKILYQKFQNHGLILSKKNRNIENT